MCHHYRQCLQWGLVLVGLTGPTIAWSAEKTTSTRPKMISIASTQSDSSIETSGVVPAGFVFHKQDTAANNSGHRPAHRVIQAPRSYCIYKRNELREVKDWFCYIKGNGPAIWVPRDMCVPQGH